MLLFESIDKGILCVVINGPYIPMHTISNMQIKKDFNSWTEEENIKVSYNARVKECKYRGVFQSFNV